MKIRTAFLAIILTTLVVELSMAQPKERGGQHHRGDHFKALFENADLSEDQQSAIKEIRKTSLKSTQSLKNVMGEKEARMKTLQTADNPNKKEILNLASEIGDIRKELYIARVESRLEIRALLSEDQRILFDNMGKGHKRGGGRFN